VNLFSKEYNIVMDIISQQCQPMLDLLIVDHFIYRGMYQDKNFTMQTPYKLSYIMLKEIHGLRERPCVGNSSNC